MKLLKVRILPFILGITSFIFFKIMSVYNGSSAVISSLAELTLTSSIFLFIIFCFDKTKNFADKSELELGKTIKIFLEKIIKIFKIKTVTSVAHEETEKTIIDEVTSIDYSDGLIEIQKTNISDHKKTKHEKSLFVIIASVLFIISFIGLIFWHTSRIFSIIPLSYTENFRYSIIHSILLLLFPFIFAIYLKMRKNNGLHSGDKTSHGILTLLSYIILIYALFIAAYVVLKINVFAIFQWLCYAVSIYLLAVLSFNIIISILKNDIIGTFNYTFFPVLVLRKNKKESILDSEEVKSSFSVKSLWTIRYSLRILPSLILFLLLILFISTTVYVVQPYQKAAVYRFGKFNRESITNPGINFKLPWPFDITHIYDVDRINFIQIGYQAAHSKNFLWTLAHEGGEHNLLLGNGNEAAAVNIKLIYKISDLYKYITVCANPEEILSAAAYNAIFRRTVNTTLDAFLSVDRSSLSSSLAEELSLFCESHNLGISVIQVIIESIHPPVDVADVYQKVITASVEKKIIITKAQTDAERRIISTEQQVSTLIGRANAEQYRRIGNAHREMAVYYAALEAYNVNQESFRITKYLNTYEKVIKENKIYFFSPKTENEMHNFFIGENPIIRLR